MIILPSRNGMLLRNSNGIISSDCGGPVAFTCPCELLEGDNSDCFDTDCTPSTYYLTWSGVQYCLTYVSGSTWNKTVGDIVVTLNLSSASETASITIVDDGVTVFSGTNTGTSCVHRWAGTMNNTITPSDWGSVTYSNNCTQPVFSCSCSFLSGDNSACFDTDLTPSTYIAVIDSNYYCLLYDSENDIWTTTIGSLVITLDLLYDDNTAELKIVDGATTVYTGYYTGTSCIHRWSGYNMSNTVSGSDWSTGSYYSECLTITGLPEFTCNCSMVTGTNCSCFGTNLTPSTYIVNLGIIELCLTYVSGCTWQATYGELTVTINLTSATNTTSLTITENGDTVFSGTIVDSSCANRMFGVVTNTVADSDWGIRDNPSDSYGYALFAPACQGSNTCTSMTRLIQVRAEVGLTELRYSYLYVYQQSFIDYPSVISGAGYLGTYCSLYVPFKVDIRHKNNGCTLYSDDLDVSYAFFLEYNNTTKVWSVFFPDASFSGSVVKNPTTVGYGESFNITVSDNSYSLPVTACDTYDFCNNTSGSIIGSVSFTLEVTLY